MDELFGTVFLLIWSIGSIAIGLFGIFFRERAADLNARGFIKLYDLTHFQLFQLQAKQARDEDWSFLILSVSVAAFIAGFVVLLSLFGLQIIR